MLAPLRVTHLDVERSIVSLSVDDAPLLVGVFRPVRLLLLAPWTHVERVLVDALQSGAIDPR